MSKIALRSTCRLILALFFLAAVPLPSEAAPAPQPVMTVLHMLDYIGVDYAGAVRDGRVSDEAEYAEQLEFAAEALAQIQRLQDRPGKAGLVAQAEALRNALRDKAQATDVSRRTAALSRALLQAYPAAVAPRRAPDVAAAAPLYQAQCSGCHGESGHGDGVLARNLTPPPADFRDLARARNRSVFGLYNVITLGVGGTAMPAFAQLSDDNRWALAFYVGQLAYDDQQRAAGAAVWKSGGAAAGLVGSLDALSNATPNDLIAAQGPAGEDLMAYLRRHPEAVAKAGDDPLARAGAALSQSLAAYRGGDPAQATQLALAAYLDGFEPVEPSLAAVDAKLMHAIERSMMDYRQQIKNGAPAAAVAAQQASIQTQLQEARSRLQGGAMSAAGSFAGSFVILAREGLEAILVIAAMIAFLRKSGRGDAMPYVHAGWVSAIVLGIATWFAATYLIDISGASREMTEGFTALLASAILLSVGLWLHNKSYSNRWQHYLAGQMQRALGRSSLWGLAALAFIAAYREIFETVLFYRALWVQGDHAAIALGFAAAALALLAIAWAILFFSMRLPIRQFFSWSSVFIVVLAVVFTGKGVAALQEAGVIPVDTVNFVSIPILGIYPTLQVLLLQLGVLMLVMSGFAWNHRAARAAVP